MTAKLKKQHFGPFTLDASSVLSRNGKEIPVPPKEMALLNLLLSYNGEVVDIKTIEREVWPRQSLSYASIARCVYSLRKILGDNDKTIISTVSKRGYRFAAPVCQTFSEGKDSVTRKAAAANTLAYSHFIEAQRLANMGSFSCMQRAVKLLEEACRQDPHFAAAHSAIADCHFYQASRGYAFPENAMKIGLAQSERALEIDGSLASAYAIRGLCLYFAGDMDAGFADLNTALRIDPGYARGYSYLSFSQCAAGMREESVVSARRAVELDPHSLVNRHALAWRLFSSGMPEEAMEMERRHISEYPDDALSYGIFGLMCAWLEIHEDSLKATKRAIQLSKKNPGLMTFYTYALARAGQKEKARALIDSLPTNKLPRAPLSFIAMTYVQLGDFHIALRLLRDSREEKCPWFRHSRFDPRIGELANDWRFNALFDAIIMTDYSRSGPA